MGVFGRQAIMARKRHSAEQIINKLGEAEVHHGQGMSVRSGWCFKTHRGGITIKFWANSERLNAIFLNTLRKPCLNVEMV